MLTKAMSRGALELDGVLLVGALLLCARQRLNGMQRPPFLQVLFKDQEGIPLAPALSMAFSSALPGACQSTLGPDKSGLCTGLQVLHTLPRIPF